jgi:hypothetical protein
MSSFLFSFLAVPRGAPDVWRYVQFFYQYLWLSHAGKTSVARALAARYTLALINPDDLVAKAVAAAEQDQQGAFALSIRLIKNFYWSWSRTFIAQNCARKLRSV